MSNILFVCRIKEKSMYKTMQPLHCLRAFVEFQQVVTFEKAMFKLEHV